MVRAVVSLGLVALALGCGSSNVFECKIDGDCDGEEALGRCEPNGFCSFPDDTCPSTRRYGTHAGDGLAGTCVPPDVADTGDSGVDDGVSMSVGESSLEGASVDASSDDDPTTVDSAPEPVCGNGIVEDGEACDGDDPGSTTCRSLGHDSGTVLCRDDCTADDSQCTDCGDGIVQPTEVCDGSTGMQTCADLGWFGGTLVCADDCQGIDESGCSNCGNGTVDPGELCDGSPGMATCESLGFTPGEVACNGECMFDTSSCGVIACGVDPLEPVGGCPDACAACENGTCVFECDDTSECAESEIVCPVGWPCLVRCSGTSSCNEAIVTCPELYSCRTECTDTSACADLQLRCSLAGTCTMVCGTDASVCSDATVDCGGDSCIAQCDEDEPAVECGPACECESCP